MKSVCRANLRCRKYGFQRSLISSLSALCFLSLFGSMLSFADATIAVGDRQFPSKVDSALGQPLLAGYNYWGRLQYLPENPTLCPGDHPSRKYSIISPVDNLPVALLAQAGGCSVLEKAQVAANMIKPANNVQYLIIQDTQKRRGHHTDNLDADNTKDNTSYDIQKVYGDDADLEYMDITDYSLERSLPISIAPPEHLRNDHHYLSGPNGVVDLAVVHVSYAVGNALFTIIGNESPLDRHQGGILIHLNDKSVSLRAVILWMIISFTMCACICCCFLVCIQASFDEQEEEDAAPRRPRRRRLTLEQVRAKFPSFHFNPEEHSQNNCCHGEESTDDAVQQPQYMQLSDECTICLDEFTVGDRVRELPCGHVFHSTCIARWLIERSAVCPLCKLDLYEEPEEEENEEEEDNNETIEQENPPESIAATSWIGRWWPGNAANREGYSQLEVPLGSPADAVLDSPDADNGEANEEETRSWWPFSLETAPSADEEDHSDNQRPQRSSPIPSPAGVFSWTMNMIGRRRRRRYNRVSSNQEGLTIDGNLVTELTEPLVSQASLEELQFTTTASASMDASSEEAMHREPLLPIVHPSANPQQSPSASTEI